MDRLEAAEETWVHYFRESLHSFIRRGDAPAQAVERAKETATLAATVVQEHNDAFVATLNKLVSETP